ncbi:MAG: hypothetical protein HY895_17105 [Deltaproteobacteria bacterium]|nr:hypothetical protein [Deltaproteobacteria bacterium]
MQPVQTTRRIDNDPGSNRIRERFKHPAGDHAAEASAIAEFKAAIKLAGDVNDFATRGLLEQIAALARVVRLEAISKIADHSREQGARL